MAIKLAYVSIFPELFKDFLHTSLLGKAHESGAIESVVINPRDFSSPPHHKVDDTPYGGGAGMLMLAEPLAAAIEDAKKFTPEALVLVMSASGNRFTQQEATRLSKAPGLIFVCGRYEGIDQRVIDECGAIEICVGDFVTFGGEIPAMLITEAVTRLIPDIIGNQQSLTEESFNENNPGLVEAPQYTKPREFRGREVPPVLLSGDPKKISAWRKEQSLMKTRANRPELLKP